MDNKEKHNQDLIKNYRNSNKLLEDRVINYKEEVRDLKTIITALEKTNIELIEEKHYFKQRSIRSNTFWSKIFGVVEDEKV